MRDLGTLGGCASEPVTIDDAGAGDRLGRDREARSGRRTDRACGRLEERRVARPRHARGTCRAEERRDCDGRSRADRRLGRLRTAWRLRLSAAARGPLAGRADPGPGNARRLREPRGRGQRAWPDRRRRGDACALGRRRRRRSRLHLGEREDARPRRSRRRRLRRRPERPRPGRRDLVARRGRPRPLLASCLRLVCRAGVDDRRVCRAVRTASRRASTDGVGSSGGAAGTRSGTATSPLIATSRSCGRTGERRRSARSAGSRARRRRSTTPARSPAGPRPGPGSGTPFSGGRAADLSPPSRGTGQGSRRRDSNP